MLSKDLSTRIMSQKVQHPSENDAQKNKNKIKGLKLQKHLVDLKNIRSCLTEEQLN